MIRDFFEDFLINKLYGVYLLLVVNDRKVIASIIFMLSKTMICSFEMLHLIPKRVNPHKISKV